MTDQATAAVLDATLESLAYLICGHREKDSHYAPVHDLGAKDFDGFEPLICSVGLKDDDILIGDSVADQPVWPVDIAVAHPSSSGLGWQEGAWQFSRFTTLLPREWRGKIRRVYPRMLDHRVMIVQPSGAKIGCRSAYAIVGKDLLNVGTVNTGLRLTVDGHGVNPDWYGRSDGKADEQGVARLLGGLALRRRYYWSVLLGEEVGPQARFLTDPIGMRAVFRLRDIPPGAARRAALLHWVRAHWRKRRDPSANDRAWVRRHLRGALSYQWNGLSCQIEPAPYDLEQLSREYQEAADG